jgi:hypothetical protein
MFWYEQVQLSVDFLKVYISRRFSLIFSLFLAYLFRRFAFLSSRRALAASASSPAPPLPQLCSWPRDTAQDSRTHPAGISCPPQDHRVSHPILEKTGLWYKMELSWGKTWRLTLIFTESEELWLDDLYRRAKGIIRHFHIWSVPHLLREDRLDKVEYVQWVQILLGEENGQ